MIQRVRGTRDFQPDEMGRRRQLEDILRKISRDYGYREIQTPTLENAELFTIKSGPGVLEEMYSFEDKGGRKIALRPELTAPIIRFYINDLSNYPIPLKLYCISNCFRYEEPQSGRYREFYQYDVEIIGSDAPDADAELLLLANDLCRRLGLNDVRFRIGHVGIVRSMLDGTPVKKEEQSAFLRLVDKKRMDDASEFLKSRDVPSKTAGRIMEVCNTKGDSSVLHSIEGEAAAYLREVLRIAETDGAMNLTVDLGVVRGLDYYTGIVFEIDAPELGAEKQICGGGSYSLSPLFGGKAVPSTGMAFGFDRLILAMEKGGKAAGKENTDVFVLAASESQRESMIRIAGSLRRRGVSAEFDLMRRSMSKSLKYASSRGARYAVMVGDREAASGKVLLRNMESGVQEEIGLEDVAEELEKRLGDAR